MAASPVDQPQGGEGQHRGKASQHQPGAHSRTRSQPGHSTCSQQSHQCTTTHHRGDRLALMTGGNASESQARQTAHQVAGTPAGHHSQPTLTELTTLHSPQPEAKHSNHQCQAQAAQQLGPAIQLGLMHTAQQVTHHVESGEFAEIGRRDPVLHHHFSADHTEVGSDQSQADAHSACPCQHPEPMRFR